MKATNLLICLLFATLIKSFPLYSQSIFEYNTPEENKVNSCKIWELPDGNIFFIAGYYNLDENNNYSYYGMLDQYGNGLWKNRYPVQHLADIIVVDDEIIVMGREFDHQGNHYVNTNKLNSDNMLVPLSRHLSICSNVSGKTTKAFLNSEQQIIVISFTIIDNQIMVIDKDGNLIDEICFPNNTKLFDLIENPDSNTYTGICISGPHPSYITYDKRFNNIGQHTNIDYLYCANIHWVNDTTLLTVGGKILSNRIIGIEHRNQDFEQILSNELVETEDIYNYPAFHKNLIYPQDGAFFYVASTKNALPHPCMEPAWITLSKINKETLDFEWVKYYGGGNYYYQVMTIEQARDGGIFLTGSRAYLQNEQRIESIVIIKTDTEGNFPLSIDNHSGEMPGQFTVFPNPGQELRIEASVEGALLELYNLNGQLLHTKSLGSGLNSINTDQLPPATYIYRISLKKDLIGSGKWVKM